MAGIDEVSDGVAFEETLGALFRWLDTIPLAERFSRLVRGQENMDESEPQAFRGYLNRAQVNGESLRTRLHESLFDEFGPARVDEHKALEAYRRFFRRLGFAESDDPIPTSLICATTNYDRSLEMALEGAGETVRTGFRGRRYRTSVLEPLDLGIFVESKPAVLYLHGAVGWYRREDGTIISMPADQGYNASLGSPAVLYPGPDKDIAQAETVELWNAFEHALAEATHVFVLGHGLNDQHLVAALNRTEARVAVSYLKKPYLASDDPPREGAVTAVAAGQRIQRMVPRAIPVACSFGPAPDVNKKDVIRWMDAERARRPELG
jgi:hypothetical protein